MTPQGSSLIDTSTIDNLIARVQATNICADLQALATRAMASLQAHITAIEQQIALLAPIEALLEIPTDLGSVLSWIEKLVTAQIRPQFQAQLNYVAGRAQLGAKVGERAAAATAAAARIGNCAAQAPALVVAAAPAAP